MKIYQVMMICAPLWVIAGMPSTAFWTLIAALVCYLADCVERLINYLDKLDKEESNGTLR